MDADDAYSGRLRVRSCGLLLEDEKLLLVQLHSPVKNKIVWLPPGGGVDFGESLQEALVREFEEETGLQVKIRQLLYVNELIESPYHAIEFYFRVEKTGGKAVLGVDPEHPPEKQILKKMRYFSQKEVQLMDIAPEFLKNDFWNLDQDFELHFS